MRSQEESRRQGPATFSQASRRDTRAGEKAGAARRQLQGVAQGSRGVAPLHDRADEPARHSGNAIVTTRPAHRRAEALAHWSAAGAVLAV